MDFTDIQSKVYLTQEQEKLETYKGMTRQQFIDSGHTSDEWDTLFCTCELDQWHNFGNEMIEDYARQSICGCVAEYINNRWKDYKHFIGEQSDWDEFVSYLKNNSSLLKLFDNDVVEDVIHNFKEYLGPTEEY